MPLNIPKVSLGHAYWICSLPSSSGKIHLMHTFAMSLIFLNTVYLTNSVCVLRYIHVIMHVNNPSLFIIGWHSIRWTCQKLFISEHIISDYIYRESYRLFLQVIDHMILFFIQVIDHMILFLREIWSLDLKNLCVAFFSDYTLGKYFLSPL